MRGVLKIGGSVVGQTGQPNWARELRERVAAGDQVVVVHGGGSAISQELERRKLPVQFVEGQRVTSDLVLTVVLDVLRGRVNGQLVTYLEAAGVPAVGISGLDRQLLVAQPIAPVLGQVGRVTQVRPDILTAIWNLPAVPVVAPLATDGAGQMLNINGDGAAGAIAEAIGADYLVFYTETGGVRAVATDPASHRASLGLDEARQWIADEVASAGMIPKLNAGISAVEHGVKRVVIGAYQPGEGTELGIREAEHDDVENFGPH